MFLLTTQQNFFLSEGFRISATLFILLILHIPLFYKIILVMVTDSIDCGIAKFFFHDWVDPNTNLYQISDKITDLVTYIILLSYVVWIKYLEKKKNIFLGILLLYRSIGEICFFVSRYRYFLFLFPNFFLETLLVFVGIKHFDISEKYLPVFGCIVLLWKMTQEYYLHIYKQNI